MIDYSETTSLKAQFSELKACASNQRRTKEVERCEQETNGFLQKNNGQIPGENR
jgi:hypothetical protein